jgi:excinuclease ABC subunit B
MKFKLHAPYEPAGDQPNAIKGILDAFDTGKEKVTLMGVTGSGKTFTISGSVFPVPGPLTVFIVAGI